MVIHSYHLKKKKLEAAFDPQASERPNNGTKNKKACAPTNERTNTQKTSDCTNEPTNEQKHIKTNELTNAPTN